MIERSIMGDIEKISSFVKGLDTFLQKWSKPLDLGCKDHMDNRIKAAYYVWARYTMSVRTIAHLSKLQFLPDLFVIARCCFEYRAALHAVLEDPAVAGQYLDFERQALCSYKKHLENAGDTERAAQVEKTLKQMGVAGSSKNRSGWCKDGYTNLVRDHGNSHDLKCYKLLSDFVHGSIVAARFLQNESLSTDSGMKVSLIVYHGYVGSTNKFLERARGSIVTPDRRQCKGDFEVVASCLLQPN